MHTQTQLTLYGTGVESESPPRSPGLGVTLSEPVSFHGLITVSATEASLLLDPEYGMLYRQNSGMTSALDSLGAN